MWWLSREGKRFKKKMERLLIHSIWMLKELNLLALYLECNFVHWTWSHRRRWIANEDAKRNGNLDLQTFNYYTRWLEWSIPLLLQSISNNKFIFELCRKSLYRWKYPFRWKFDTGINLWMRISEVEMNPILLEMNPIVPCWFNFSRMNK